MTVPQFAQSHIFRGTTLLLLRQHGLHISQRNRRGEAWLETEIPYEELLPVGLEYHRPGPLRMPPAGTWVAIWVLVQGLSRLLHDKAPLPMELWVACGGFLLGLLAVILIRRYRGRRVQLITNRIHLTLRHQPGQRDALDTFVDAMRLRAHAYLREEYATVNPLGPIELQLHRLHWLHQLHVLSEHELRTLSTRLTGRLSLDPVKLMGQDLETPYVN
ncbi:hypothetical protein [Hymenobacter metallilatus]|uniref:Uncharacterized protein n=1 Tax=Hymenobacter metallilatus TaxID=2493666 RepID=A0A428JGH2_9BACT|nr:hypothetical protein [Hymenobacter metallilatus]RSK31673.1 hypothetical protein EI290_12645 [Hymenobacter metallilatus]